MRAASIGTVRKTNQLLVERIPAMGHWNDAHAFVLERQEGSRLKDTIRVADSACYGPCSEPKDSLDQHTCLEQRSLHDFEGIQVLLWHRNLMIFDYIHKIRIATRTTNMTHGSSRVYDSSFFSQTLASNRNRNQGAGMAL